MTDIRSRPLTALRRCRSILIIPLVAWILAGCERPGSAGTSPFQYAWTFDDATAYDFDPGFVAIGGGAAQLVPLDLELDSDPELEAGIHAGTRLANGELTTETTPWPGVAILLPNRLGALVGAWRMDESAWNGAPDEVSDDSGLGHHGTAIGDATTVRRAEQVNRAGRFDGTGDAVRIDVPATTAENFTLVLWIDPDRLAGITRRHLITFTESGIATLTLGYSGTYDDGRIRPGSLYLIDDNSRVTSTATGVLDMARHEARWTHLAIIGKEGRIRFLVDGQPVDPTIEEADGRLRFDRIWIGGVPGSGFEYAGVLDDVVLWNQALTDTEAVLQYQRSRARIAGVHTGSTIDAGCGSARWDALEWRTPLPFLKGLPGARGSERALDYPLLVGSTGMPGDDDLMQGLIALWHLDEVVPGTVANGTLFSDASGNGHDATALNPDGTIFSMPGRIGRALHFTLQSSDYLTTSLYPDWPRGTLSLWIRTDAEDRPYLPGENIMAAAGAHDGSHRFYIGISQDYQVIAGFGDRYVEHNRLSTDRRWYHLVLTGDGTTARIYVDGVQAFQFAYNYPAGGSSDPFLIGAKTYKGQIPNNKFQGAIDEVAIWDRPLNPHEIRQLYRRGANRILLQLRTCKLSDCSDRDPVPGGGWLGSAGLPGGAFSELQNNTLIDGAGMGIGTAMASPPYLPLSRLSAGPLVGRYLQWRAILLSDDENTLCGGGTQACTPSLHDLSFRSRQGDTVFGAQEIRYACGDAIVTTRTALEFRHLTRFRDASNCTVRYLLSNDDGRTWQYHDGNGWGAAIDATDDWNTADELEKSIERFPAGDGRLRIRAWLPSDGGTPCRLDEVEIEGYR